MIARPLSDLTKKDVEFKFSDDGKRAFNKLKRILCNEPVLTLYDPKMKTELHADASSMGLVAILLQIKSDDGELHPIYFTSSCIRVYFYY